MFVGLVHHVENILLSRMLLHHGPTIHLDYICGGFTTSLKKRKTHFRLAFFFTFRKCGWRVRICAGPGPVKIWIKMNLLKRSRDHLPAQYEHRIYIHRYLTAVRLATIVSGLKSRRFDWKLASLWKKQGLDFPVDSSQHSILSIRDVKKTQLAHPAEKEGKTTDERRFERWK
jgi:hypothetical protein